MTGLGAGVCIAPPRLYAQPTAKMSRVGMLVIATQEQAANFVRPFEEELRALGYVPDRNIVFEHRFANGNADLLPDLAAAMVRLKLDVIISPSNQNTTVAKKATLDIPIVAMFISQPVEMGFVKSLARPGGNVTGLTVDVDAELWAKRLEILKEVKPHARRVAVLVDQAFPGENPSRKTLVAASQKLDVALDFFTVRFAGDFDRAIANVVRQRADALVVTSGPLLGSTGKD